MSRYYSPEGGFAIQIKIWIQNSIVLNVIKSFQEPSTILSFIWFLCDSLFSK